MSHNRPGEAPPKLVTRNSKLETGVDGVAAIDAVDRGIIAATQEGLPLVPRPYHEVARRVGIAPEEVMARMQRMLEAGIIRRMGAIPNHYALGYRANGMSVWDVPDEHISELGRKASSGSLPETRS